jgi:hypothetical protein
MDFGQKCLQQAESIRRGDEAHKTLRALGQFANLKSRRMPVVT